MMTGCDKDIGREVSLMSGIEFTHFFCMSILLNRKKKLG